MYKSFIIDENELSELVDDYSDSPIYSPVVDVGTLKNNLRKLILSSQTGDKSIKAKNIWDSFFPKVNMPVFLSHSSKDKTFVRKFANWLFTNFGIVSFIDSDLWGCISELQKEIDQSYCLQPGKTSTYDYDERNYSTAHVHMILSYALTRMIQNAECFIFIKSNNSISVEDSVMGTFSPWIFHELATVDTIQIKRPERMDEELRKSIESAYVQFNEEMRSMKIQYPVPCKKLVYLDINDLTKLCKLEYPEESIYEDWEFYLNELYKITL